MDTHLVAGTANNGWEDSSGSVISSKASFAHAGAIVNNKSSNVFVTHLGLFGVSSSEKTCEGNEYSETIVLTMLFSYGFYMRQFWANSQQTSCEPYLVRKHKRKCCLTSGQLL